MNRPSRQDELRADIEQTRERLGETVEQLAHKADIPARTKEKVAEVSDKLGGKVEQAADIAVAKLPEPARQKAAGVAAFISARPLPTAGGLLLLVWLLVRLIRGRSE